MPKILPHSDHVVASPWPVQSKVCRSQIAIPCSETLKQKMLCHAQFEAASDCDSRSPRAFPADRVRRPRVQGVRNVLTEQKIGGAEKEQTLQLSPCKRAHFHISRQHVASERIAGRIFAAEITGVGRAQIRIRLVVRRSDVELAVSPDKVVGQEKSPSIHG